MLHLLLVISLSLIVFYCLGLPLIKNENSFLTVGMRLAAGMYINYGISLTISNLTVATTISILLAVLFVYIYSKELFSKNPLTSLTQQQVKITLITIIISLYYFKILSSPILEWDERFVWFFHAKMIYFSNGINDQTGINLLKYHFHYDYPKLFPLLSAQVMNVLGYWNEYTPKIVMLITYIPILFIVFAFFEVSFRGFFLIIVSFLTINTVIWLGQPDGHIALYIALSALMFHMYKEQTEVGSQKRDSFFTYALILASIAVGIKNEGLLFFLIFVVFSLPDFFSRRRSSQFILTLLVMIFPMIYWNTFCDLHGLRSDLGTQLIDYPQGLFFRFFDPASYIQIFKFMLFGENLLINLLVLLLVVSVIKRKLTWPLIFGMMYFSGLFIVYMTTPYDLAWHLETSAHRTVLVVCMLFQYAVFLALPVGYLAKD